MGKAWTRIAATATAFAVGALACVVAPATVASAAPVDDGLDESVDATYTALTDRHVIHADITLVAVNHKPSSQSGGRIVNYYFTGTRMAVPAGVTNVAITASGRPAKVSYSDSNDKRVQIADVSFSKNIFYNDRDTLHIEFDMPESAPRSKDLTRINPAYLSFWVFLTGDPGHIKARIQVPEKFDLTTSGTSVTSTVANGQRVYELVPKDDADVVGLEIFGENRDALQADTFAIGDDKFSVRSWPNDTDWATFMRTQLTNGQPALERIIGQPWPLTTTLEVRETITPYLLGYGGWYDDRAGIIDIGEQLRSDVALHELSHAWFNTKTFSARWINEGLAEEISRRAVLDTGGTAAGRVPASRTSQFAVALNDWANPASSDADAGDKEDYGYRATATLIRDLVDEIGVEKFRAVLADAFGRRNPYDRTGGQLVLTGATDWKRFLDSLESTGGSTKAQAAFRTWVLSTADAALLGDRTDARTAYAKLNSEPGGWTAPTLVRDLMGQWKFGDATKAMGDASSALAARDQLAADAAAAGLTLTVRGKDGYERATVSFVTVTAAIQQQREAMDAVVAARAKVAAPRSFAQKVGLRGKDVDAIVADAADALARDDLTAATDRSAEAVTTIEGAAAAGRTQIRNAVIGLVALLVLLALGIVLLVRRRHRRQQPATIPALENTFSEQSAADGDAGPEPVDLEEIGGRGGT